MSGDPPAGNTRTAAGDHGTGGRRAFVLAGGGTLAATQVGMLRALFERGITPDLIVGTSAGALNGAFLAGDPSLARVDALDQLWRSAPRGLIFPVSPRALVLGITGRRDYLVANAGLRDWIERCLDYRNLEDAAIGIHVVATELTTGQVVVLSSGPAVTALLASTAIPGVFPPITIGDRLLVDGGIAADTPIVPASELGATDLWVLPTVDTHGRPPRGALAVLLRAMSAVLDRQTEADAHRLRGRDVVVHAIPAPPTPDLSMFDFRHGPALVELAYASTCAWLDGDEGPAVAGATPDTARFSIAPAGGLLEKGRSAYRHRRSRRPARLPME